MSHAIDIFAVLGRKDNSLVCDGIKSIWEENKQCHPNEIWNESITDLIVVNEFTSEVIDDSWTVIDSSVDGVKFSELGLEISIAFRRRRHSHRADHICMV